jgi:hypothetical protein
MLYQLEGEGLFVTATATSFSKGVGWGALLEKLTPHPVGRPKIVLEQGPHGVGQRAVLVVKQGGGGGGNFWLGARREGGGVWNCGLLTGLEGICGSGVAAFSMHTVEWDTHSLGCHVPQH